MITPADIQEHGGIAVVITHPIYRTLEGPAEWQNTIICYDGWTRALTCEEEEALAQLPAELTAPEDLHVVVDERVE